MHDQGDRPAATDEATLVARLYVLLAGVDSLEAFLAELAGLAADEVDRGLSCGLTVRLAGRPVVVASSDDLAEQLDQAQYSAGEGPGLDAMAAGESVEVQNLASGSQWPQWRARGSALGVRKSLSMPLVAGDTTLGVLNTYSTSDERFTEADRAATGKFAAQAAGALAVAAHLSEQVEFATHLDSALRSHAVIDQATGFVMATEHCAPDEALARLRSTAQRRGIRLLDLAHDTIEQATFPPDQEPDRLA